MKPSNPKDSLGIKRPPMSTVPAPVMMELGVAMLEGARKYARHNYRVVGVKASVYYDACERHMMRWWEGEDIDPESGLNHVVKAIASLVVLRDAMMNDMVEDDRPPPAKEGWFEQLAEAAARIIEMYPDAKAPYVRRPHPLAGDPIEEQTFG